MERKAKLILALQQVDNLSHLLSDGPYAAFFASHLLPVKFECERQLCLLKNEQR